jgi:hypothetical protein
MRRTAPERIAAAAAALALATLLGLAAASVVAQGSPQTPVYCEAPRMTGSSNTHGGGGLMVPVSVDQLTDESSLVFAGTVVGFQSCASAGPESIFTRVTLVPDRIMKGAAGKTVRLSIPGGSYGGYRLGVGTSPEFTAGERVIVFAGPNGSDLVPVQGDQSTLEIAADGHVAGSTLDDLASAINKAATGALSPKENARFTIGHAETNYSTLGPSWITSSIPVQYQMNVTNSRPAQLAAQDARNAIANALHTWQNENTAYVAFGPLTETTRTSYENGCDGLNDTTFGISNAAHSSSTLAVTYTCYSGSTMIDADVEIDVDHFGSSWRTNGQGNCDGYFDLETVLLHEYGHALGLGHPSFNGGCASCPVMDGSYGGIQRTLCTDDMLGVVALYTVVGGSPPATPGNVGASRSGAVTLTWGDVTGEMGFEIWRAPLPCASAQDSSFKLLDTVSDNVLSYVDNDYGGGLDAGATYCYKLRSFNTTVPGPFSATVQSDGSQVPTPSPSPTPSPTSTPSPTPTPTPSATPTPTPSLTPSPTPTPSPTRTPSPTPTPSPSPTATPTPTTAPSPTPSPTPAGTPTASPAPTQTTTPTPTPTPTPPLATTEPPSPTESPSATPDESPMPTITPTPTPAPTASPVPSAPPALNGDVDCSGDLNSVDALRILRHVVELGADPACIVRGDTNCDGNIDATDALRVLRNVAGISSLTASCGP